MKTKTENNKDSGFLTTSWVEYYLSSWWNSVNGYVDGIWREKFDLTKTDQLADVQNKIKTQLKKISNQYKNSFDPFI